MTRFHRPTVREIVASATILLAVAGCSNDGGAFEQTDASAEVIADYDFVIPIGAGIALDEGTPLDIGLPADFQVAVGETIQIANEDDRGHNVGPWFVGADETMRQTFASPGEFVGICTVHPSGEITVTVSA